MVTTTMPMMQQAFRPAIALAPTAPQFAAAPMMRPGHPALGLAQGMCNKLRHLLLSNTHNKPLNKFAPTISE